MPPALNRGLARRATLLPLVRFYALASRPLSPPAALPLADAASAREELANARATDDDNARLTDDGDMQSDKAPPVARKNFLARLTSWTPLFWRLRNSPDAFNALRYEADVRNRLAVQEPAGTRLVDDARHSRSMELWLEILRFRLRLDGQHGVMDVLEAMAERRLVLPLQGPQADAIWSILVSSAVQYPQLLRCLYSYVLDTLPHSCLRDLGLYSRIVGPLLRQNPMFALTWHKRMQKDQLLPADLVSLLARFVDHACLSQHKSRAIEAFKKIYLGLETTGLYDECMMRVCRLTDFATAVDFHVFFVRHNDHPSPHMKMTPIVAHLTEHVWLARSSLKFPSRRARFAEQLLDAQHDFQSLKPSELPSEPQSVPPLTRESMSTLVGDVHNIREKELGDSFCARLFATTAFSTDLIITGLRMLGLQTLGNLALREIAARAPTPAEYIVTVDAIKAAGISVAESIFGRALLSFAANPDKHQSFRCLVTSDQHPSAYEDHTLQKRIFGSFLTSGKPIEANAVLDILTLDELDPQAYHANLILQVYARRARREFVLQILHEMRLHRIAVSEASMRTIQFIALRPRRRSKKPVAQQQHWYNDDLNFVTNIFLEAMRMGQSFDPSRWREILKRYGQTNRLQALERLTIWLALWYSGRFGHISRPILALPNRNRDLNRLQDPLAAGSSRQHPLTVIFTEHLLRAIIAWGFRSDVSPSLPPTVELNSLPEFDSKGRPVKRSVAKRNPERWARGLALIRELKNLGINLQHKKLRREVKLRLWILYGPSRSNNLLNRLARKHNQLSLVHRVRHIEDIMGKTWLMLGRNLRGRREVEISERDMHRALFGHPRRTGRRTFNTRG